MCNGLRARERKNWTPDRKMGRQTNRSGLLKTDCSPRVQTKDRLISLLYFCPAALPPDQDPGRPAKLLSTSRFGCEASVDFLFLGVPDEDVGVQSVPAFRADVILRNGNARGTRSPDMVQPVDGIEFTIPVAKG